LSEKPAHWRVFLSVETGQFSSSENQLVVKLGILSLLKQFIDRAVFTMHLS